MDGSSYPNWFHGNNKHTHTHTRCIYDKDALVCVYVLHLGDGFMLCNLELNLGSDFYSDRDRYLTKTGVDDLWQSIDL